MDNVLHTKFGTAKIHKTGYYVITSCKEGNHSKRLHRLIYEEEYGKIPDGCIIHHIDGDKLNNDISNLTVMTPSEHTILHHTGRKRSDESKRKMSEARIGKYCGENHPFYGKKRPEISKRMSGENNPNYGKQHSDETKQKMSESQKRKLHTYATKVKQSKSKNTSGYFRVDKWKDSKSKRDFVWRYRYFDEDNRRRSIQSVSLDKLKEKVLSKGLEWKVIDEEKSEGD